jgi:hypothetical protein
MNVNTLVSRARFGCTLTKVLVRFILTMLGQFKSHGISPTGIPSVGIKFQSFTRIARDKDAKLENGVSLMLFCQ